MEHKVYRGSGFTRKNLRWRFLVILGATVICILGVTGFPPSLAKMKERIHLGLDLRGGMHLILQVVTDDAVNIETDLRGRATQRESSLAADCFLGSSQERCEDHRNPRCGSTEDLGGPCSH